MWLNTQTWAVIGDVAEPARAQQVMKVVDDKLDFKAGTVLIYPAYKTPDTEIGYLTRYSAGTRENGGTYTHAATWTVIAQAKLKKADAAFRAFSKLNPIVRGAKPDEYVAEPYVTPGNIEGPDSRFYGRGGWTWYTGSAAWLFKVGVEWILGVRPSREGLIVDPCIPSSWKEYSVKRNFRGAAYHITVKNPNGVSFGVKEISLNGKKIVITGIKYQCVIPVCPAGSVNSVEVLLEK